MIRNDALLPRRIFWLTKWEELEDREQSIALRRGIGRGTFGHPALILGSSEITGSQEQIFHVLVITSTPLKGKKKASKQWMPFNNKQIGLPQGLHLDLSEGDSLRKEAFLCWSQVHLVTREMLDRNWSKKGFSKIDEDSWKVLIDRIEALPPKQAGVLPENIINLMGRTWPSSTVPSTDGKNQESAESGSAQILASDQQDTETSPLLGPIESHHPYELFTTHSVYHYPGGNPEGRPPLHPASDVGYVSNSSQRSNSPWSLSRNQRRTQSSLGDDVEGGLGIGNGCFQVGIAAAVSTVIVVSIWVACRFVKDPWL
ncbi:MAG: hypothetical protein M1814_003736 [Vezdaea aestivalis]|nr:MAG: hypothetical protein M1814_003736 [Vezdaea aestivalis]